MTHIELSPESGSAIRTATNRKDWYGFMGSDITSIDEEKRDKAIRALNDYKRVLVRVSDKPTLFDPNNENTQLSWVNKALDELNYRPKVE